MIEQLASTDFQSLPDNAITLLRGEQRTALEVKEIRLLGQHAGRAQQPFAVVLRENGARRMLPQGMFRFEHPVHGTLDLFTVPIGPDGVGACYEIIFN